MIAKQVPNRHDGKSDFGTLAKYITGGMTAAGLASQATSLPGFGQLTQYMSNEVDDAGKEKCVAVCLNRLQSVGTAPAEFYSKAARNPSVSDPVVHLILSWPEHERPSYESVFDAGRDVLKALNLQDHQWLMAIHNDTDNLHCHIEVSRIHPDTYKSQHLPWMHKTLHRAAREVEIKNRWSHDNGLFVVRELPDGRKFVVPNDRYKETQGIKHEPYVERLARMESWSDERSLVDHCKEVVSKEVIEAITAGKDWTAIHDVFERHGMRIEKTGEAAFRLEAMTSEGKVVRLPISKALRSVKFGSVESVVGPFVASTKPLQSASTSETPQKPSLEPASRSGRRSKRDPEKREARKLERAADRTALIDRFKAEKAANSVIRATVGKELAAVAVEKKQALSALRRSLVSQKQALLKGGLDPAQRKATTSLIAFERINETARIHAEAATRRAAILERRPPTLSWREWIEAEAKSGDKAAVSALRGMVYQERRDANKATGEQTAPDEDDAESVLASLLAREREEDAIRSAKPNRIRAHQADVLLREIASLKWRVTNNGNIEYQRETGSTVFVDRGNKLTFDRKLVSDDDLKIALLHAREKWGGGIVLTAGDAAFTQRMVRAAVEAGITVKNPELQQMQSIVKAQIGKPEGRSKTSSGTRRKR
ncbi:relaxase/mobilization nuclease domain-containing protein [Caballeronia sp. LP003]|uniref:TraI/MobA(P) family conjugative relaxase n=1 Tax=Caballeronia sp. LP003 TaxID=3038551 RepID=UPI002859618B|nr:TraI/MobA(P) family conjugative relaxase [Caballeronia sp. LP003]MDR5791677.1 relaxase/mobilization nuclease domain-containing protein [Caballeronia sp. LP003]